MATSKHSKYHKSSKSKKYKWSAVIAPALILSLSLGFIILFASGGNLAYAFAPRQDTTPPTIAHTPITFAIRGQPLSISANVTDASGIAGVKLYYSLYVNNKWSQTSSQVMSLSRGSANTYTFGLTAGTISRATKIKYNVEAKDKAKGKANVARTRQVTADVASQTTATVMFASNIPYSLQDVPFSATGERATFNLDGAYWGPGGSGFNLNVGSSHSFTWINPIYLGQEHQMRVGDSVGISRGRILTITDIAVDGTLTISINKSLVTITPQIMPHEYFKVIDDVALYKTALAPEQGTVNLLISSGTRYSLDSVSGLSTSQEGTIIVPEGGGQITANYKEQKYLSFEYNPPEGGGISAASDWYDADSEFSVSATPNQGYQFSSWYISADGEYQTENPITLHPIAPSTITANFAQMQPTVPQPVSEEIITPSISNVRIAPDADGNLTVSATITPGSSEINTLPNQRPFLVYNYDYNIQGSSGSGSYSDQAPLVDGSSYTFTIPQSRISTSRQVHFQIAATDVERNSAITKYITVNLPLASEQLASDANTPIIIHTSLTSVTRGEDIPITTEATDDASAAPSINLGWKVFGPSSEQWTLHGVDMTQTGAATANIETGHYTYDYDYYTIPGTWTTSPAHNRFGYSMIARDSDGNKGTINSVTVPILARVWPSFIAAAIRVIDAQYNTSSRTLKLFLYNTGNVNVPLRNRATSPTTTWVLKDSSGSAICSSDWSGAGNAAECTSGCGDAVIIAPGELKAVTLGLADSSCDISAYADESIFTFIIDFSGVTTATSSFVKTSQTYSCTLATGKNFTQYPLFGEICWDGLVVIGSGAQGASDVVAAVDIGTGVANADLGCSTGIPSVKLDTEITSEQKASEYLILIGHESVNTLIAELYGAPYPSGTYPSSAAVDQGQLLLCQSPWNANKPVVVVTGNSAQGTRHAAEHLKQFGGRIRDELLFGRSCVATNGTETGLACTL